jgi:uncharacterized protein YecE (DUF72 family)
MDDEGRKSTPRSSSSVSSAMNQPNLFNDTPTLAPNLHLGTQGFTYPSWVGSFYAPGTPSSAFLERYAAQFATVELDTTFYAVPRLSTITGWRDRTPDGFQFAAKFPQAITHQKALVDCRAETVAFLDQMTHLDRKLGPLLLQMPPSWGAGAFEALVAFFGNLPTGFKYALEVRHKSWLAPAVLSKLLGLLQRQGVALCLVQHAWMPALNEVTAPFVYVRWLGRREDIPDDDFSHVRINRDVQLDQWAGQIRGYLEAGLMVYGYFNNHYQGHSPASVRALQARLPGIK